MVTDTTHQPAADSTFIKHAELTMQEIEDYVVGQASEEGVYALLFLCLAFAAILENTLN